MILQLGSIVIFQPREFSGKKKIELTEKLIQELCYKNDGIYFKTNSCSVSVTGLKD